MVRRMKTTFPILIVGLAICGCQKRERGQTGEWWEPGMNPVERPWPVQAVTFSADGRWLAAGRGYRDAVIFWPDGGDGEVNVWGVQDWKRQDGFTAPFTFWAGAVAFTPDSKSLVATSDHFIRSKRRRRNQLDEQGRHLAGAFNPRGGTNVFIWKVPEGTLSKHLNMEKDQGNTAALAISPDSTLLGLGRWDAAPVLQIKTGQPVYVLEGITCWIDFSPDGKTLVTASRVPSLRLHDATSGKKLASLEVKGEELTYLRFSPDGKQIAVGVSDGSVRVLAADLSKQLRSLSVSDDKQTVRSLAYAAKADLLAAATPERVRLFEASSGKKLREWAEADMQSWSVGLSPDGKQLAVGYVGRIEGENEFRRGYVNIWDTATGRLVKKLD